MAFRRYVAPGQHQRPGPKPIGQIMGELFARRGYGRVQGAAALADAWRQTVGEDLAAKSRVGALRRGRLEIIVGSSLLSQELMFQKARLLADLQQRLSADAVRDLRFRVGAV